MAILADDGVKRKAQKALQERSFAVLWNFGDHRDECEPQDGLARRLVVRSRELDETSDVMHKGRGDAHDQHPVKKKDQKPRGFGGRV